MILNEASRITKLRIYITHIVLRFMNENSMVIGHSSDFLFSVPTILGSAPEFLECTKK